MGTARPPRPGRGYNPAPFVLPAAASAATLTRARRLARESFIQEVPHVLDVFTRATRYPPEVPAEWEERTRCPVNDRLCGEGVWFGQTMLLGPQSDMDDIATAIRKIYGAAADLARGTETKTRGVVLSFAAGLEYGNTFCFQEGRFDDSDLDRFHDGFHDLLFGSKRC